MVRASELMPAFVALYAAESGSDMTDEIEDVMTIDPPPASRM